MAQTNLNFSKEGDAWAAYATITEATPFHVQRKNEGHFALGVKFYNDETLGYDTVDKNFRNKRVIAGVLESEVYPFYAKFFSTTEVKKAYIGKAES